jgi:glycosyltransferase involved in cell wall biosynthesis
MKVLIDGVVFENTYQKGIRRYFEEVLSRSGHDFAILLEQTLAGSVPEDWKIIKPIGLPPSRRDLLGRLKYRKQAAERRDKISEYSVFHSSWFRLCPLPGIPTVVTIYDMLSEAMPTQYWGDASADSMAKAEAIKSADAIITISETTKLDLLKLFPDIRAQVYSIPLGADHLLMSAVASVDSRKTGESSSEPYVLFVGDRVGYKNFHVLLEAMCQSEWPDGVRLKVAGSALSSPEYACLHYMGLRDVVDVCGFVSDEGLASLYSNAIAFVFPSLFEGFGLPMLEAQARMAPVVANDMAVFHEVGGDAFLPCDCRIPVAIARAITTVMIPEVRLNLLEAGQRNVQRFSWDDTAQRTFAVWESVARR